ncbi:MAG: hypothetical protein B1H40_00135 [Candidatus Latescibacteria bacterium 4484_181]|nr:MAG: hypothetical protein B1H40_00135 [Candidatus Latescibacteria bacterium 4484_181]
MGRLCTLYRVAKRFKDCSDRYYDIGSRRTLEGRKAWKDLVRAEQVLFQVIEDMENEQASG